MIVGIDYGSKLAGTTVVCYLLNEVLITKQSKKGQDADQFVWEVCNELNISLIGVDAPLSLPGIYFGKLNKENYFYRQCDIELRAMSPMFIGGLTARAIQLRDRLITKTIEVIEVYPKAFVENLEYKELYQKKNLDTLSKFFKHLKKEFELKVEEFPTNWHQVDGMIAWLIVRNYELKTHREIGDNEEGLIIY